jgi:integrase
LLLRYTALRISDVALLERSGVREGQIFVRATKNGKPIFLPLPAVLLDALEQLPRPRAAEGESKYYFWSGNGSESADIRDTDRTMRRVYKISGVPGAHNHRFRHKLATELLAAGATYEDVSDILVSSPAIIRKHYAQWSSGRQERISNPAANRVFCDVFATGQKRVCKY